MKVKSVGALVEGITSPYAEVEVENLSIAPYSDDHYVNRVKADATGHFAVAVPDARKDDVLRVWAEGQSTDVISLMSGAARRPEVEVQGLRVSADGRVENVLSNPRVAAPGTLLTFKTKTDAFDFIVGEDGLGPERLPLELAPGDKIDVRVNGKKKKWTSLTVAGLDTPKADGDAHVVDGKPYVKGVSANDPAQGPLGDCWIIATLSAIAHVDKSIIDKTMLVNEDGSYTVKLKRWNGERFVSAAQVVPKEFNAYASSTQQGEAWPAIFEAAYAQWKGSFVAAEVGYPMAAFEAILGRRGAHTPFDVVDAEEVLKRAAQASKTPTLAVSRVGGGLPYEDKGIVPDHAYTVLGVRNGRVQLRNPWGHFEPTGNGKDDGVFELSLDEYREFFAYSCAA